MYFEKYHGTGNDFILFINEPQDPNALALKVCDRHFGIGADGILYPSKSNIADIKMNYYNSDGSIAKMCGNGLRCFVKFVRSHGMVTKEQFIVETKAGLIAVKVQGNDITLNLGEPRTHLGTDILTKEVNLEDGYTFNVNNQKVKGYLLTTGTMHTIIYMNDYPNLSIEEIAPLIQKDQIFKDQSNINFVTVKENGIHVKTYERGAGWTLSCGTGVAASAFVSYYLRLVKDNVDVTVPGGKLTVEIKNRNIYLTGPAVKICHGEYDENI